MRTTLLCAALAVALAPAATAETRSYNITGFNGVAASSSANVELKQGPFSITADSSGSLEDLIIEKRGDTLVVKRESRGWWGGGSRARINVTVTAPDIGRLDASSSADINASGYRFADLDVNVSSSGNVSLSGTCGSLDLNVSSSGDFRGEGLRCDSARVNASSSGDADVFATRSADGAASSSGDIRIHGKPPQVQRHTSSSGSVKVL